MTVLRVYLPPECGPDGFPLDYEKCRTCGGIGQENLDPARLAPCPKCDGHGSLKAAALRGRLALTHEFDSHLIVRCEDCQHPMSEGVWEDVSPVPRDLRDPGAAASWFVDGLAALREGVEPGRGEVTFFSACDEKCEHGDDRGRYTDGVMRTMLIRCPPDSSFEASWRPVDLRLLSWPHDLRPDMLAVLCLRCWAARTA